MRPVAIRHLKFSKTVGVGAGAAPLGISIFFCRRKACLIFPFRIAPTTWDIFPSGKGRADRTNPTKAEDEKPHFAYPKKGRVARNPEYCAKQKKKGWGIARTIRQGFPEDPNTPPTCGYAKIAPHAKKADLENATML